MVAFALLAAGAALTLVTLFLAAPGLPQRPNHAGRTIPTATGLVFLPITLMPLLGIFFVGSWGVGGAFLVYALVVGMVGFVDDVWGGAGRGFSGHLGALVRGRVTTGLFKLVVFGGGALVYAVVAADGFVRVSCAAVLMAGSTNLANLFDVRPGRAIKFVGLLLLVALPFVPSRAAVLPALPIVGGVLALFAFDVRGRIMLGDAGAAVLGAVLGHFIVVGGPGPAWWFYLAVILGLTVLAEVSSISRVIERVSLLRKFDSWGRG